MKNKVITIMFLLSIIILIVSMSVGVKIGDSGELSILSISQVVEKNKKASEKINEAVVLSSVNYEESISKLEENHESYLQKKEEYEQTYDLATNKKKKSIFETKQYDIGYLWKKIGKYATSYNLSIKIDVNSIENEQPNLYNLSFQVHGEYTNISQFLVQLENDSDFNFRIYNFKINGQDNDINAYFTVKNVMIDPSTFKMQDQG